MMTHAGPPRPWWGQEGPAGAQPAGLLGLEGRFSRMDLGTTTATVAVATAPLPADKPRGPGAAPQLLACHGPAAAAAVTACDGPGMDRTSPTTVLLASPPGSGCSTPAACSPPTAGPGGAGLLAGGPGSGAAAAAGEQAPQRLRPSNGAASAPPLRPSGGGGGPSGPVKEVTVDSLVKAVLRARSGQPVVEAVREGLYCLDGRAVAALLKELAKNGLQYAASGEPGDWGGAVGGRQGFGQEGRRVSKGDRAWVLGGAALTGGPWTWTSLCPGCCAGVAALGGSLLVLPAQMHPQFTPPL